MAESLQEYVISLSTHIDNAGVSRLLSLLDTSRLKTLGVTAALTAATTAVYKFVESTVKQEFELEQLAKKQKKTIEDTRAQETALKAMGKTLNDIKKDRALKEVYDDIKKTNKALEMPNITNAMKSVTELRNAFWKLKSIANMAITAIGEKVLIQLEAPIKRITGGLKKVTDWLRENFNSVTSKISSFITAFAKGIIGIGETFVKIGKLIGKLPDSIKAVGGAIGVVMALIKSGPLGQLLALVTAVGGLIDDYENYQYNKELEKKGLKEGQEFVQEGKTKYYRAEVALPEVWEMFDNGDFGGIASSVIDGITGALNGFTEFLKTFDLGSWLEDPTNQMSGFIQSCTEWFNNDGETKLLGLAQALIKALGAALSKEGELGTSLMGALVTSLSVFNEDDVKKVFEGNDVSDALSTGLINFLLGADPLTSIATGIGSLFSGVKETLGKEYDALTDEQMNAYSGKEDYINSNFWKRAGLNVAELGTGLLGMFQTAIRGVDNFGQQVIGFIAEAIKPELPGLSEILSNFTFNDESGQPSKLGDILINGILGGITTGNFIGALAGAVGTILTELKTPEDWGELATELSELGKDICDFLFGKVEEGADGTQTRKGGLWNALKEFFSGIWEGGLKTELETVWGHVQEWWRSTVKPAIEAALASILPDWAKDLLDVDNKSSKLYQNGSGVALVDSDGNEIKTEGAPSAEATEFLRAMAPYLKIKDDGYVQLTENVDWGGVSELSKWYYGRMGLGDRMSSENLLGADKEIVEQLINKIIRGGENAGLPSSNGKEATASEVIGVFNRGTKNGEKKLTIPVTPIIDYNSIQTDLNGRSFNVNLVGTVTEVKKEGEETNKPEEPQAWGGRIGRERRGLTVGEDGPEYIIPITKPDRAMNLIYQMLGEMGGKALAGIKERFGLGEPGTYGSMMGSAAGIMGGSNISSNYSISAPVTIYVTATGSNGETIGQSAYDAAERHIMRTLKGVFA